MTLNTFNLRNGKLSILDLVPVALLWTINTAALPAGVSNAGSMFVDYISEYVHPE